MEVPELFPKPFARILNFFFVFFFECSFFSLDPFSHLHAEVGALLDLASAARADQAVVLDGGEAHLLELPVVKLPLLV